MINLLIKNFQLYEIFQEKGKKNQNQGKYQLQPYWWVIFV